MNNALSASLSLVAIVSTSPVAAAAPAPLRAWTLGDYTARHADAAARAQDVTIDGNGVATYRDPVGAPIRIEAPLTATAPDTVLLLADIAVSGGRGGIIEGAIDTRVVDHAFAVARANGVIRGGVDRPDLRSLTDDAGLTDAVGGLVPHVVWPSQGLGDVGLAGQSLEADPHALVVTLADAGDLPRRMVPAAEHLRGEGMAGNAARRIDGRTGIPVRTGSVRALPQSVNGGVLPEPATWATMIVGFAVIGLALRRKTVLRFV